MEINPKTAAALKLAVEYETMEEFTSAADAYRKAIEAAGVADPTLVGTLHIDLGNAERAAGLIDQAIGSYQRATDLLAGQKGMALLQRGFAFLNMAYEFYLKNDHRAVLAAAESLKLHRAYPYTSAADLADAVALDFVARLVFEKQIAEADFEVAWHEIKAAPCASVMRSVAFDFISLYLQFVKSARPHQYAAIRSEIEQWTLPDLFAEAVSLAENGIDSYRSVSIHQRLQRALFGIPDYE